MKKILLIMCLVPLILSCVTDGRTDRDKVSKDSDSIVVKTEAKMLPVIGIVGEGTTMHELELLTVNDSDASSVETLYFSYNVTTGGIAVGDRVVVAWFESDKDDVLITNLTSLSHLWTLENSNGTQAIQFDDDFNVTTYGMDNLYEHWTVNDGRIELFNNDTTDIYDIQLLTEDSLILMNESKTLKFLKRN